MTRKQIAKFLILRTVGNFLLLFSLYGVGATFGPAVYYETRFRISQARGVTFVVSDPVPTSIPTAQTITPTPIHEPSLGDVIAGQKEQVLVPRDTAFSIIIPRIGATAKIFPNVDPANEAEFTDVLQHGIAHAKGTVFPGMKGNIYLFAHSADTWWNAGRYNAIFYLLKDLQVGDDVIVYFENRRHNYTVSERVIVEPNNTDLLVNNRTDSEQLIMQTCWPPGTTFQRLIVKALPKKT